MNLFITCWFQRLMSCIGTRDRLWRHERGTKKWWLGHRYENMSKGSNFRIIVILVPLITATGLETRSRKVYKISGWAVHIFFIGKLVLEESLIRLLVQRFLAVQRCFEATINLSHLWTHRSFPFFIGEWASVTRRWEARKLIHRSLA